MPLLAGQIADILLSWLTIDFYKKGPGCIAFTRICIRLYACTHFVPLDKQWTTPIPSQALSFQDFFPAVMPSGLWMLVFYLL